MGGLFDSEGETRTIVAPRRTNALRFMAEGRPAAAVDDKLSWESFARVRSR
jgi:hypothetical protein